MWYASSLLPLSLCARLLVAKPAPRLTENPVSNQAGFINFDHYARSIYSTIARYGETPHASHAIDTVDDGVHQVERRGTPPSAASFSLLDLQTDSGFRPGIPWGYITLPNQPAERFPVIFDTGNPTTAIPGFKCRPGVGGEGCAGPNKYFEGGHYTVRDLMLTTYN